MENKFLREVMFNMKKMKKILAFCLCAMLMTTVPTFTETASAATTSTKKTTSTTTKKKTTIKGWYKLKTGGMRYFKKRQIHYRLS